MITYKAKNAAGEFINSALSPFTFPAGEAHIKREDRRDLESVEVAVIQSTNESIHDDLFHLAMWNDYLVHENKDNPEHQIKRVLLIPYFPGARADRGQPFGLKVYADFIRNLELDQIIIFDPHSGMTGDTLHAAAEYVTFLYPHDILNAHDLYAGVIAPDKGAFNRASKVAELMGVPCYTAEKIRDFETGKIKGVVVEISPTPDPSEIFLVVDDICDGGGTFMALAQYLDIPRDQIDLYVSHGVFSGQSADLNKYYNHIFTTNSYQSGYGRAPHHTALDIIRPMSRRIKY